MKRNRDGGNIRRLTYAKEARDGGTDRRTVENSDTGFTRIERENTGCTESNPSDMGDKVSIIEGKGEESKISYLSV